MIRLRLTIRTPLILFVIVLLTCHSAYSQSKSKWRIKNRLQASYEFDDNIRESPSDSTDRIGDSSLRFIFSSQAQNRNPKTQLKLGYKGGLQNYFENSFENKLINEISAAATCNIVKTKLGLNASGRLKIYLNDVFDYASGSVETFFAFPAFFNLSNTISAQLSSLDYQNFSAFNYSDMALSYTVSSRIYSNVTGSLKMGLNYFDYRKRAINASFDAIAEKQEDEIQFLQIKLNYTKSILLNLIYSFEHRDSNSFGYSNYRHQFVLIFGIPLPKMIWVRGYGAIQIKNYKENTLPVFPTDVDTERDESNFFILDLSKDINSNLTGLIRVAYYNNESIIRSHFYHKFLFTTGFDFRF